MTEASPIWQTWDFWNFIIALIALLAALYSIWYTRQRDKLSLEITDTTYEELPHNPHFVCFSLFNNSSTALRLTNVELFELNGKPASVILGHEYQFPPKTTTATSLFDLPAHHLASPHYFENPFQREILIPANDFIEFKYYITPFSPNMTIKVTSDKPIHRWSKTKTFSVHFVQSD